MPFPFIIGAGAIVAGVLGLANHASAKEKNEKAQRICNNAKYNFDEAQKNAEKKFADVNKVLGDLGQEKLEITHDSVSKFKYSFNKIKHVSDLFEHGKELNFNLFSRLTNKYLLQ